jgi:hypothetical protein
MSDITIDLRDFQVFFAARAECGRMALLSRGPSCGNPMAIPNFLFQN